MTTARTTTAGLTATISGVSRSTSSTRYIPSLDGMRAISIMLVMFSHAGLDHLVPGGLGVAIFFVISGYLITNQMINEIDTTGKLSLKDFYIRRVFRLAPALLVYIAVMTPVVIFIGAKVAPASVAASVLYMANYWELYFGFGHYSPYPILWSLSVEEHYYILFPIIVTLFIPDLRRMMVPILIAGLVALLWRIYLQDACETGHSTWLLCGLPQTPEMPDGVRIYHGTDTRFDSILTGAFLALAAAYGSRRWSSILYGNLALAVSIGVLLLTLLFRDMAFRDTIRYTLQSVAIAVAIANVIFYDKSPFRSILSLGPVVYIGRLSYSLYLWHYATKILIVWMFGMFTWKDLDFYLFFGVSILLASVSYHFIEQPMIKFRRRFGSHATRQTA